MNGLVQAQFDVGQISFVFVFFQLLPLRIHYDRDKTLNGSYESNSRNSTPGGINLLECLCR